MRRALLAALVAGLLAAATPATAPRAVSLVVVIVVDQLPAGKLEQVESRLSGGLRRFLKEGRRYTRCEHAHAATETAPGHATLLSGLYPSHNGIVANDWHDVTAHRDVYCAASASGGEGAAGPRNHDGTRAATADQLDGENLADLMKRFDPKSRVWSVAGKDRSAVLTAGHHPDGVFWFSQKTGGFTANPAVVRELPSWGAEFWAADLAATKLYRRLPDQWTYALRGDWGPDDVATESPTYSRVSPHPLMAAAPGAGADDTAAARARRIFTSPWVDWLTLQLAGRILERAGLGDDASPDLLIVGLSGADAVGHSYGPDSQEYLDVLIHLDGWLGDFMDAARRRGPVLFALSADHGVLPLPERVPGARRIPDQELPARLEKAAAARWSGRGAGPFIEAFNGTDVYLDRRALDRAGLTPAEAAEALKADLSSWPEVARVYTAADLSKEPAPSDDLYVTLYRNRYRAGRSGDLSLQPCEKCLITSRSEGTSHGSPYDYDRDVPMILLGPGLRAGRDDAECRTVDLAPTLAAWLGLAFSDRRDGRPLPSALPVDSAPPGK